MLGLDSVVRSYVAWCIQERGRVDEACLRQIWQVVVGRAVAGRTSPVGLRGGRLEVVVPDSMWMTELRFRSADILRRLNRVLPDQVPEVVELRPRVGNVRPTLVPSSLHGRARRTSTEQPLTSEQAAALAEVSDPQLRRLVGSIVRRDGWRRLESASGDHPETDDQTTRERKILGNDVAD